MELVPIIYTALIIVSVLITLTLIISFISYKFKKKTGDNLKVYEKFPAERKTKAQSHKSVSTSKHIKKEKSERAHAKKRTDRKSSPSGKKPAIEKQPRKESPDFSSRKKPSGKRIEIVDKLIKNNDRNQKTDKPQKVKKKQEEKAKPKMHTLGDDILGKYSDEEGDDFHTLNVDK